MSLIANQVHRRHLLQRQLNITLCDRHAGEPVVLPRRRLVEQASLNAPATRSEVAEDLLDSARKPITTGLYGFISPVESFDTDASRALSRSMTTSTCSSTVSGYATVQRRRKVSHTVAYVSEWDMCSSSSLTSPDCTRTPMAQVIDIRTRLSSRSSALLGLAEVTRTGGEKRDHSRPRGYQLDGRRTSRVLSVPML
jgi:hypothetical protein